jgi:three-Cys-motif partner protein
MHSGKRQLNTERCHKLACLADYFDLYTKSGGCKPMGYLELFSAGAIAPCSNTACHLNCAARLALEIGHRFDLYILAERNEGSRSRIKEITAPFIEANLIILPLQQWDTPLHTIPRGMSLLTLIDPPGYRDLRWARLEKMARHSHDGRGYKSDLLLFLPLEMALLRNFTRPDCESSVDNLYGNHEWQSVRQARLEGRLTLAETKDRLVGLYKAGLKDLGYRFVEDVVPPSRPTSYQLLWASDSRSRRKDLVSIWEKPRYLPCELLYESSFLKGNHRA